MLADIQLNHLHRGAQVDHSSLDTLTHWYPVAIDVDVAIDSAPAIVCWRRLGEQRLTAAFFEDSFTGQSASARLVCRTPLSTISTLALPEAVAPTAFVFHVSRCGSTLLTQMLATLAHCIVVSEPPVLDAFFRLHQSSPERSGGAHTLRKLVAALGQRRFGETHFFVKLDSWHMPWLPWLRQVFPSTPFLVLYRDPVQVLDSHRRQRGAHMVPGLVDLSQLKLNTTGLQPGDLDGFGSRVLAAIFSAAEAAAALPGVSLLNYEQLPSALWTHLLAKWEVPCDSSQLAVLQTRATFNAKSASAAFAGDPSTPTIHFSPPDTALEKARASYSRLSRL